MKRFHVWEQFHTLDNIPVFSEACAPEAAASACCVPQASAARSVSIPVAAAPCCGPSSSAQPSGCC